MYKLYFSMLFVRNYISLSILMICLSLTLHGQKLDPKYETVFIYQISKYVEWPVDVKTFVIGVIGESNSPIIPELVQMAKIKKVDGKAIEIKVFANASQINVNCHIVFVTYKQSVNIGDIVNKVSGKNTLIIAEKPGLAKKGSAVNFINIGGKIRFELNKNVCTKAGLKVSGYLESLAILVN